MPVYTYKCTECGHRFDEFQHFTDDSLTVCPACHQISLRKVYQPVGIVFKGKGFYATDNRSTSGLTSSHVKEEGSFANNGADSGESKPAASKDSAAKEAAPAPKAETQPSSEK